MTVAKAVKKKIKAKKKSPVRKLKKKPVRKAAPKKVAAKKPVSKRTRGIPEILRDAALKILDDRKAEDIVTVDLEGRSAVADYLIIASGRSGRQVAAIAHYLRDAFLKHGSKQPRLEGLPEGNWVLVDSGDVIVHLFRPEVRKYYQLDELFNGKR